MSVFSYYHKAARGSEPPSCLWGFAWQYRKWLDLFRYRPKPGMMYESIS